MQGSWSVGSLFRLLGLAALMCVGWLLFSSGEARAAEPPDPAAPPSSRLVDLSGTTLTGVATAAEQGLDDLVDTAVATRTTEPPTSGASAAHPASSRKPASTPAKDSKVVSASTPPKPAATRSNRESSSLARRLAPAVRVAPVSSEVADVVERVGDGTQLVAGELLATTSTVAPAAAPATSALDDFIEDLGSTVCSVGGIVRSTGTRLDAVITSVGGLVDDVLDPVVGTLPTLPKTPSPTPSSPAALAPAMPAGDAVAHGPTSIGGSGDSGWRAGHEVVVVADRSGPDDSGPLASAPSTPPASPAPTSSNSQIGGAAYELMAGPFLAGAGTKSRIPSTADSVPAGRHPLPGSRPD